MPAAQDIFAAAKILRATSSGLKAWTVEILSAIHDRPEWSVAICRQMAAGITLEKSSELLRQIAQELSCPYVVVVDILRCLELDMRDDSEYYRRCSEAYTDARLSETSAAALLRTSQSRDREIFVLYRCLHFWDISKKKSFRSGLEDNVGNTLLIGYFCQRGRCFQTAVDLLAYAYSESWPSVDAFWKQF